MWMEIEPQLLQRESSGISYEPPLGQAQVFEINLNALIMAALGQPRQEEVHKAVGASVTMQAWVHGYVQLVTFLLTDPEVRCYSVCF